MKKAKGVKPENKLKTKRGALKYVIAAAVCVIINILISNYSALCLLTGDYQSMQLDLVSGYKNGSDNGFEYSAKTGAVQLETGRFEFDDVGVDIRNICIEIGDGPYRYMEVTAAFTDRNFSLDDGLTANVGTYKIFLGGNEKNYINVSSFGEVGKLTLQFGAGAGAPFLINSVTLNRVPSFRFSLFRLAVMLLACFAVMSGAWRWKVKHSDYALIGLGTAVVCIILTGITFMSVFFTGEALLDEFPLEDKYTSDQYEQLFSSFYEGRVDINVDVTAEEMEKTGDPYDLTMRRANDPAGDYWDRAYFDGKFYSYFGIAPIFTVYCPVYFLTGKVPSAVLSSMLVTIYAVIFLSLLYMELLRRLTDDPPLIPALLGHLALIFASSILALNSEMLFYFIAVISGIGSLAAFFYFLLKAFFETSLKKRCVFLVLTGISIVLTAGSRPNMLIYCAAALTAVIYIASGREDHCKVKVKESPKLYALYGCALGVPVLLGAAGLMTYNYSRFGDPFEFGFSYQLTVSNALANGISLSYIPAAVYHYFIEPPEYRSEFPFVSLATGSLQIYPRYTYITNCMGVLNYPIIMAAFLYPAVRRRMKGFRGAFTLTLMICAVVLAFVDMCKAGAHYRYTADILLPLIVAALVVMFSLLSSFENVSQRAYAFAYTAAVLALCATITLGFLLIFANENSYYMFDYAAVTQMLRKA